MLEIDPGSPWLCLRALFRFASSGSPLPIFGRQGHHSGGHISGVPSLPPLSILQNPGKDIGLGGLASRGRAALYTYATYTVINQN